MGKQVGNSQINWCPLREVAKKTWDQGCKNIAFHSSRYCHVVSKDINI